MDIDKSSPRGEQLSDQKPALCAGFLVFLFWFFGFLVFRFFFFSVTSQDNQLLVASFITSQDNQFPRVLVFQCISVLCYSRISLVVVFCTVHDLVQPRFMFGFIRKPTPRLQSSRFTRFSKYTQLDKQYQIKRSLFAM